MVHFIEFVPKSARDLLDGTCAYRMEMIDVLSASARKRLGSVVSKRPELEAIISERQYVCDEVEKAVGSYKSTVKNKNTNNHIHIAGSRKPIQSTSHLPAVRRALRRQSV